MGKNRREPRDTKDKPDLIIPIDLTIFGTENDPCFGKLHDLTAPECRQCGDSELCAIATSHANSKKRFKLESQQSFKDMEDTEQDLKEKRVRRYINKRLEKGKTLNGSIKRAAIRYDLPIFRIKEIHENK